MALNVIIEFIGCTGKLSYICPAAFWRDRHISTLSLFINVINSNAEVGDFFLVL